MLTAELEHNLRVYDTPDRIQQAADTIEELICIASKVCFLTDGSPGLTQIALEAMHLLRQGIDLNVMPYQGGELYFHGHQVAKFVILRDLGLEV